MGFIELMSFFLNRKLGIMRQGCGNLIVSMEMTSVGVTFCTAVWSTFIQRPKTTCHSSIVWSQTTTTTSSLQLSNVPKNLCRSLTIHCLLVQPQSKAMISSTKMLWRRALWIHLTSTSLGLCSTVSIQMTSNNKPWTILSAWFAKLIKYGQLNQLIFFILTFGHFKTYLLTSRVLTNQAHVRRDEETGGRVHMIYFRSYD